MKDNEQKTVHSNNFRRKDLLENKNKIRTIKAEVNTKNVLSKFGKQKCTVINKKISNDYLSTGEV